MELSPLALEWQIIASDPEPPWPLWMFHPTRPCAKGLNNVNWSLRLCPTLFLSNWAEETVWSRDLWRDIWSIRQARAKVRKCSLRFLPWTHNYFTTIIQSSLHLNHKGIIIVSDSDREKETQRAWACDATRSGSEAHVALLQACVFMLCYGSRATPHTAHGQKLLVLWSLWGLLGLMTQLNLSHSPNSQTN